LPDALHEIAVAGEHDGSVIDEGIPRAVESLSEHGFCKCEADRHTQSLTERAGRRFDAARPGELGVSGSSRAEPPEGQQVLPGNAVSVKVLQRVEEG
jgi:hypothetical protein